MRDFLPQIKTAQKIVAIKAGELSDQNSSAALSAYLQETELVTANLTGATRLLLTGATALPLVVAFIARKGGQAPTSFQLAATRRLELGVLLIT